MDLYASFLTGVQTLGISRDAPDPDGGASGAAAGVALRNSAFLPVALKTSGHALELHAVVVCGRLLVHVCMPDGETYSVELDQAPFAQAPLPLGLVLDEASTYVYIYIYVYIYESLYDDETLKFGSRPIPTA